MILDNKNKDSKKCVGCGNIFFRVNQANYRWVKQRYCSNKCVIEEQRKESLKRKKQIQLTSEQALDFYCGKCKELSIDNICKCKGSFRFNCYQYNDTPACRKYKEKPYEKPRF